MILISYWESESSFYLSVDGHAGYAQAGQDIVCAGVSALVQTLALSLDDLSDSYTVDVDKGDSRIGAAGEKIMIVYRAVKKALHDIAESYPDHVTMQKAG